MRIPFRFETARTIQILGDVAAADSRQPAAPSDREVQPEKHTCGNCHACCINLPIPAGEVSMNIKPPGVRCPHLAENGCQVYSSRPQMCSQFSCTWLAESSWPEAWRPEQSGLLCLQEDIDNGVSAALVYEIAPKALERPSAPLILAKLVESTAMVAVVNLHRQRQLLQGRLWVDEAAHPIRRPHFLRSIHSIQSGAQASLRDAS